MTFKKFAWGLALVGIAVIGMFSFNNHQASAFTNFCDVLARPSSPGGGNAANCQNGQVETALNNLIGLSGQGLKNQFIADIQNFAATGYPFQRIGASYIAAHLQQHGGDWITNTNQADVTLQISTSSSCINTAYGVAANAVVMTGDCALNHQTVKFIQNGVLVYEIKLDCGNPLGNLGGPTSTPNWSTIDLASNSAGSGTVLAGTYVVFSQYVHNYGPDVATVGYQVTYQYFGDGSAALPFGPYNVIAMGSNTNSSSYGALGLTAPADPRITSMCVSIASSPVSTANAGAQGAQSCVNVKHPWQLVGNTVPSIPTTGSIYPGQSITFTSSVTNNGPGTTDPFAYGPRWFYSTTKTPALNAAGYYDGEQVTIPNGVTALTAGTSVTGIVQTVAIPLAEAGNVFICGTVAFAPPNDTNVPANGRSPAQCVQINHPTATCVGGLNFLPTSTPEPNVPFTAIPTVTFSGSTPATDAAYVYGTTPGDRVFVKIFSGTTLVFSASGGAVSGGTITGSFPSTGLPLGVYTTQYGVAGSTIPNANITCTGPPMSVSNKPYFDVRGGDVAAGTNFFSGPTSCAPGDPTAGIKSWNDDNAGASGYYGAGAQMGAYALSHITSFPTGINPLANATPVASRPGSPPASLLSGNGNDHSFAPSTTGTTGDYGGNFGQLPCMTDYSSAISNTSPAWGGDFTRSGSYYSGGSLTIGDGSLKTLGIDANNYGVVINIKVNGDAYITSNIAYNDTAGPGRYPRLNIIATGNIYVDPEVDTLHGLFVAQGGLFASCANAGGVLRNFNPCADKPLTVYGSVDAKQLDLARSLGTLTSNTGPAESFRYGPEFWMATPDCLVNNTDQLCTNGAGVLPWQAVTSLPPTL